MEMSSRLLSMPLYPPLGPFQPTKEFFTIHSEKTSYLRMVITKQTDRDLVDTQQLPVEEPLDGIAGMPHSSVFSIIRSFRRFTFPPQVGNISFIIYFCR